jgi:hypothetical protein
MQVFLGVRSGYTYVVPLKNKACAFTALQDFIRYVGAPAYIDEDAAKEENMGEWFQYAVRIAYHSVRQSPCTRTLTG